MGLNKKMLYNLCVDIAKKIKNANCDSKFYPAELCKAMDKAKGEDKISARKVIFEAESQYLTPIDFLRIVFSFSAD